MAEYCRFYEKDKDGNETKDNKCYAKSDEPKDVDKETLRWLCGDRNCAWSNCKRYNRDVPRDKDGYNVATATFMRLERRDSVVLKTIKSLIDNELRTKEEYKDFNKIYSGDEGSTAIGAFLAGQIYPDAGVTKKVNGIDKNYNRINKIYSKLLEIASLYNCGDTEEEKEAARDLAAKRYILLVLKLVKEYGLEKEYREYRDNNTGYRQKNFAKTYTNYVNKHKQNNTKTLD
ncbi:MAG: hypothetical protein IKZ96_03165 [Bacilli bacterium]|nr:hypothetical protein [Bacilli bacterium]